MDTKRAEKEQSGFGEFSRLLFSWPSLAVVASVAALLFEGVHFKLVRPPGGASTATGELPAELRVESRSWKDPFQAVLPNVPTAKDLNAVFEQFAGGASNTLASVALQLSGTNRLAVMAVLVVGNPYPNGVESRIRSRIAIQSAMRAGGFVGEDSEHLRYLIHCRTADPTNANVTAANRANWIYIPFEWFKTDPTVANRGASYDRILLLWLKESDFLPAPFARLHALFARLLPETTNACSNVQLAILGPRSSGGLEAMIKDDSFASRKCDANAGDRVACAANLLLNAQIISATATAPDAFFVKHDGTNDVNRLRRARVKKKIEDNLPGSTFTHYGATDADLCYLLVAELAMRGVDVHKDQIVLMSEYDTFYGRQLPLTFSAAVMSLDDRIEFWPSARQPVGLVSTILNGGEGPASASTTNYLSLMERFETSLARLEAGSIGLATNIRHFTYLAGVDGDRTVRDNPKTGAKDSSRNPEDDDSIDRPEGEHQLDYMGRLVLELNGRWQELLQSGDPVNEVKAIGVLGSDFYDKLLMLQALRPSAPRGIYFTTDLDARLNLRSQRTWTRNVITASGFGLRPATGSNDTLMPLAPMRDGYQTATFAGCLNFLHPKSLPGSDLGVYEIGRVMPHRLHPPVLHVNQAARAPVDVWRWSWSHIQRAPQYLAQAPTLAAAIGGYLILLLLVTLLDTKRNFWWRIARGLLGLLWLVLSIVVSVWLFSDGMEPFELGDGVSSFASALILCFTLALILYTLWCYYREDHENGDPTNTPAFVIAFIGILALTWAVLRNVNPPFRGPSYWHLGMLMMAVWLGSSMTVITAVFFWRRFAYDARRLLQDVETAGNGTDLRQVAEKAAALAQRTRRLGTTHFLPMAVLFMLLLGCSSWTDSWYWTPWMASLVIFELVLLLFYPILLNRVAAYLHERLDQALTRLEDATADAPEATPDQPADRAPETAEAARVSGHDLAMARKLVGRLDSGCFAPLSRQPVFAALGAALGTSGLVTLLQPLLSGN